MKCFNLRALARNGLYLSVLCVLLLSTGCALFRSKDHASPAFVNKPLVWDPQIIQGELDNGLRYLAYPSNNTQDGLRLRLLVGAGSVHETDQQIGVAHMLEHMVFHETDDYPDGIHTWLAQQGWQTGREINALTQQTRTKYMLRIPADSDVSLERGMNLLANMAVKAHLKADDWQQERSLVLGEWRRFDSHRAAINEQKRAVIRAGSAFINRPTIGNYTAIRNASVSDLRSFYQRWYIPANMTLIVSGNFSSDNLMQALEKEFSSLKNPADVSQVIAQAKAALTLPKNQRLVTGRVSPASSEATPMLVLGLKSSIKRDRDLLADRSRLIDNLIRKLLIQQALQQRAGLPSEIQSLSLRADELTPHTRAMTIAVRSEDPKTSMDQILQQLAVLRQHGFSQSLFGVVQEKILTQIDRLIKRNNRPDYLTWEDRLVTAVVQQKVAEDLNLRYPRIRQFIAELTLDQVNQYLQNNWLLDDDVFIYLQADDSVSWSAPDQGSWTALWQQTRKLPVLAVVQKNNHAKEKAQVLPDWPAVSTPSYKTERHRAKRWQYSPTNKGESGSEVREWQLTNGDRLVWWPVGDSLNLQAVSRAGYQMQGIRSDLSQLAQQLGAQSGLKGWSQQQWQNSLVTHGGAGFWQQTPASLNWMHAGKASNLPLWLRQYRALVEQGWVSDDAWEQGRKALARQIQTSGQQQTLEQQQRSQFIYGSDATPLSQQANANVSKADLEALWQQQLRQPVTWYLVGKLDEEQLLQNFARYIEPVSRKSDLYSAPVLQRSGQHRMSFSAEGLNDDVRIRYQLRAYRQQTWSPQLAKQIEHLAPLVQKALKQRLRTELGGVYSVDYRLTLDPQTDRLESQLSFVAAPSQAEMLADEVIKVLQQLPDRLPDYQPASRSQFPRLMSRVMSHLKLRALIQSDLAKDDGQWLRQWSSLEQDSAQPDADELINTKKLKEISGQLLPLPERVELFWQEN
ncbi:M16 family metallopeptidase [Bacterioplanoides sp.]|uniref:M16 family metallopeptidase n=1 Tax=Bacterioplanoides sp. TaxID=2066072 RepID=UPI003B5C6F77